MALTEAHVVIYHSKTAWVSDPVLKWLPLLLCRLLVVGPVLKWFALLSFLRVHSPGHTFGYFCSNFVCSFVRTVQCAPRYTIFDLTNWDIFVTLFAFCSPVN